MHSPEQLPAEVKLHECSEILLSVSTEIFEAAEQKEPEKRWLSEDDAIWRRLSAFQRLAQQQFPTKEIHTTLGGLPEESFEGMSVVMGGSDYESEKPFINTWLEVPQGDQIMLVGMQRQPDNSYELKTGVFQRDRVEEGRQSFGFRPMSKTEMLEEGILLGTGYQDKGGSKDIERLSFQIAYTEAHGVDHLSYTDDPLELASFCSIDLEHPRVKQVMELVNGGEVSRTERIALASEMRQEQIAQAWQRELALLPEEVKEAYGLDEDMASWERYLQARYEEYKDDVKDWDSHKELTLENFKHNYTFLMLDHHATVLRDEIVRRVDAMQEKEYESFHEKMSDRSITSAVFVGALITADSYGSPREDPERRHLDGNSLITHTISEKSMLLAARDGLVGDTGVGRVCTSQDRITNGGRGKVIVWRVQDILDAGYPLYKVREDFRDADVLREMRSYALPLALAVKIDSLDNVPDHEKAQGAQIHAPDQFAGVEYLDELRAALEKGE